jgi:hypothetical protein
MKGVYHYRVFNVFTQEYTAKQMHVKVLKENEKSYYVEYLEFHENGHRPGTKSWVRKSNVKSITDASGSAKVEIKSRAQTWQPYKD